MTEACIVDGKTLRLNGVGYRKLFMVNVYKAALYTVRGVQSESELYTFESPVRIRIEYLHGPIDRARIAGAWADALAKAAPSCPDRDRFLETVTEYKKGDIVDYDLLTTGVLQTSTNGGQPVRIESRSLCVGVLDVIFGPDPIDRRMKAGLLTAEPWAQEAPR